MPEGEGAAGPPAGDAGGGADRPPSAHSQGSGFSEHKSQEDVQEAAARKADEDREKKGGGMFGRFGFGKKRESATEDGGAGGDNGGAEAASEEDDEEEAQLAAGPDSDEDEEGSQAGGAAGGAHAGYGAGDSPKSSAADADAPADAPKPKKGFLSFSWLPFRRTKPAEDKASETGSDASGKGTTPKARGAVSSPRATSGSRPATSTKSAVQRAVEKSLFVQLGRMLRIVFWRDESMQTGKEGSLELSRIAKANPYSMRGLQQRVYRMQRMVAILSMIGLLCGVAVNEYCWLGYIPTPEEEAGSCSVPGDHQTESECRRAGGRWTEGLINPTNLESGQACRSPQNRQLGGLILKSLSSGLTGILLMAIFHLYECIAIELCFRNHLEYHREFVDVPFWNMGLLPEFLMEVLACIVHPGPQLHFNLIVQARGRVTVYNSESFLVALMFVRMYTLWRYYREWMFMRYTSKNFASRLSDVEMDSKLAIKAILADVPFETITFLFGFMTFTLAYLVRIAEAPANIDHVYFWNQLWLIVVTATSTGYGDLYPVTHLGRGVCILAMIIGILLTAVLITTVSNKLELNAGESKLMNFLQSEHWENEIKKAACQCIQSWWRRAIFHPRTLQALRNFKMKKKAYRKFLDSTPHFSSFVENMRQDTEMVRQTLSKIEGKVVSGLDLGKLDTRGGAGLAGLGGAGAGNAVAAMGGNPVPSKVFGDVMLELAQLRKANTQLKAMIEKGNIQPAPILANAYQQGGATTPGRMGGMTPGRTGSLGGTTPGRGPSSTFQRVGSGSSQRGGVGATSYRRGGGGGGGGSGNNTARSGQFYAGQDPAVIASKAVEERVRRLEIQVNNFDKGMAKCLSQIVRLLQGLY